MIKQAETFGLESTVTTRTYSYNTKTTSLTSDKLPKQTGAHLIFQRNVKQNVYEDRCHAFSEITVLYNDVDAFKNNGLKYELSCKVLPMK